MGRRRSIGWVVAIVASLAVGLGTAGAPAAGGTGTPTVAVVPSTGLRSGDTVTVTLSGFPPGTTLVGSCPPGAASPFDCEIRHYVIVEVAADGTASVPFRPLRLIRASNAPPGAPPTDCATASCTVGVAAVFPLGVPTVQHPVDFEDEPIPPPALTIATDQLVDSSLARIVGSGFQPHETVRIGQCLPGALSMSSCALGLLSSATADAEGDLLGDVFVHRLVRLPDPPGAVADCGIETCTLGLQTMTGFHQVPLEIDDPGLAVEVQPIATVDLVDGDIVATITVSCELPTPIALRASIVQGPTSRSVTIGHRWCEPGVPSTTAVAGYAALGDGSFGVGPATVSVAAAAATDLEPGDPITGLTTASAVVDVLDAAPIVAAVSGLIADPANVALRDAVVAAIRDRVTYDPVFAARFAALLSAG